MEQLSPATARHHIIDQVASEQPASPVRYIQSHAALRGVAALTVVAYHLQFGAAYRLPIETTTLFFQRGYLLVDLFFILSGFVISLTSHADLVMPDARETYRFYAARLTRLYPLHAFCLFYIVAYTLAFGAALGWYHGAENPAFTSAMVRSLIEEALLIQAWIPAAPYWNIPSWSISAELFAYALFPLLAALGGRLPQAARWPLLLAFPLAFYGWIGGTTGSLDIIAGIAPWRCLAGFMVGMALFQLRGTVSTWPTPALGLCQIGAAVTIILMMMVRIADPLVVPFFAILVISTWQDRGPLPAALRHRSMRWAGDRSYSIYLNHVCLIAIVTSLWSRVQRALSVPESVSRVVFLALCFAVVLMVSQWTYRHVEQGSRRFLRRVLA